MTVSLAQTVMTNIKSERLSKCIMQVTHHADGLDICLTAVGTRAVPAWPGHAPPALPEWWKTMTAVPPPLRVGKPRPLECPLSIPVPPPALVPAERVLGSGKMKKRGGQ